jgi:predicted  nucleic acid-binding Zn-ribbon protein
LTKEIELQGLEVQLCEKRIREAQVRIYAKEETLKEAKGKMSEKKKNLEAKKVELEKIIENTEKEEKKLKRASTSARKDIEERLITSYEKIRGRYRNGLAVVPVDRGACGGCFNEIPPQIQLEISLRKKVVACEHCGRRSPGIPAQGGRYGRIADFRSRRRPWCSVGLQRRCPNGATIGRDVR